MSVNKQDPLSRRAWARRNRKSPSHFRLSEVGLVRRVPWNLRVGLSGPYLKTFYTLTGRALRAGRSIHPLEILRNLKKA